jgi:signal transduction histidine kinase
VPRQPLSGLAGDSEQAQFPPSGVIVSPFWDKPWLDVSLGIIIAFASLNIAVITDNRYLSMADLSGNLMVYIGAFTAVFSALALWWALSAMKRLKTLTILKHTLIYTVLAFILRIFRRFALRPLKNFCRAVYNGFPLTVQIGLCALGYAFGLFLFTVFTFASSGILVFLLIFWAFGVPAYFVWKALYLANVAKGISRLAGGDYNTPVEEKGHGVLKRMAQDINAATDGLKAAVQKELTSQRFKTELITNVSHDLRTPLTSVITYAELLQTEGVGSSEASKYVDIIQQKARRLQALTEDIFTAAKAASGETSAILAPFNLNQLIAQTVGEFGDRLCAAGLDTRFAGTGGMVMADGKLLCRVFENLLRNVEKYALSGTRVYIDRTDRDKRAVITLRNISAAPIEGDMAHLTERFTRGDEARSTEGGLPL